MHYRLLNWMLSERWCLDRTRMAAMLPIALSALTQGPRTDQPAQPRQAIPLVAQSEDEIEVIFASGVIGHRLSGMDIKCGGLCLAQLQADLREAANRSNRILLHLDTPGGAVSGLSQTVATIRQLRERGVEIGCYTDTMCCSAGYWIASACDWIVADPQADVGSIGCYSALLDLSRMYEDKGAKVELFVGLGAALKAAGYPGTSLTDEQRGHIQAGVDQVAREFRAQVQSARRVPDEAINGGAWSGQQLIDYELVDALVETREDVFGLFGG